MFYCRRCWSSEVRIELRGSTWLLHEDPHSALCSKAGGGSVGSSSKRTLQSRGWNMLSLHTVVYELSHCNQTA